MLLDSSHGAYRGQSVFDCPFAAEMDCFMNKQKMVRCSLVAVGIWVSLLDFSGCSSDSAITTTTTKAQVESRRDELQKKTQSGIPGKPAKSAGGGR
jgi:hypothetical protein